MVEMPVSEAVRNAQAKYEVYRGVPINAPV